MATYQQIELQKNTLNDVVAHKVSIYSESLRNRLGQIADFKGEFDAAFDGFVENTLPKDHIYKQIEEEIEAKRKKKKGGANTLTAAVPAKEKETLLPDPNEKEHEKVSKSVAGYKAKQEMERIKDHEVLEEAERAKVLVQKAKKKKKTGEVSEEEEAPFVPHEEVEFKLAKQFDQQLAQITKVDYDMVKTVTMGKVKALQENDLKVYEQIEAKEMDRAEIKKYVKGEVQVDKNEINVDELNKDYGKDLDQAAYADFWKNEQRKRGSQSVKPQRPGSQEKLAALSTPDRKRREVRDQLFPEIQKNSVWKNKEIDIDTLYEDPLFDFNRPIQKKRKLNMSIPGGILNFDKPMLPSIPQSTQAASQQLPDIPEADQTDPAAADSVTQAMQPPPGATQPDVNATAAQASDNIDAAQNFFEEGQQAEKPKPKQPKVDQGMIDTLKREKKKLEDILEVTKKTFKIEMQQAKRKAIEMSEEMLQNKLSGMRETYEEEFEGLARQFADMVTETNETRDREDKLRRTLFEQEAQISQMNNLYEAAGRDQVLMDEQSHMTGSIEGVKQEELVEFQIEMNENPESVHTEAIEIVNKGDILLTQPWDFFGFSICLNYEQQIDIANRTYIKFYKMHINELNNEKDLIFMELESNRRLLNTFKQASEKSARKIKELEIRESIAEEEGVKLKKEAERKVKKLSADYVELYKVLAKKFNKLAQYVNFEIETHENIKTCIDKVVSKKEGEIEQLEEALKVPRQHFKFITDITTAEILKQKDEIIKEMAGNMGIPPDKLLSVLYKKEAAKKAKLEVENGLKEDAPDETAGASQDKEEESPGHEKKGGLGKEEDHADMSGKQNAVIAGAPKLQRDLSVTTILSQATADTMAGSLIAPPFKFGTQKQYKQLGEYASRQGNRPNKGELAHEEKQKEKASKSPEKQKE